ncbi:MAG TPA: hypothetical protein VN461_15425 [Vicinamibacteria bacterium]|jgi:hypothetical protein|nr:hypothetical protein [Vicinamibacteria bacterium]
MKDLGQLAFLLMLLVPVPTWAGKAPKLAPPDLPSEHVCPSKAFSFRTPADWKVESGGSSPEIVQAQGDSVVVRFLHRGEEAGFDGLHVDCMAERLSGTPLDSEPQVEYEYDFVSGRIRGRRALDSAFRVIYDSPILGSREWRQRNITLVGEGESLCVIAFCPMKLWKKSPATRALLDGVLASITLR